MKNIIVLFLSLFLLQGCLYDARTSMLKREGVTALNAEKGNQLLEQAWIKHGGNNLEKHQVYSFNGFDTWKESRLGKLGKIWPDYKTNMHFKFQVEILDGQLTFIDGQRQGVTLGLTNSNYYEIENGIIEFQDKHAESNIRAIFGLSHIQYFFELIGRLRDAPIVSFAGSEEYSGNQYDLVFATWGNIEPHLEHDQYLLWINKATGLLDYVQYSVREPHVKPPGYKAIGGNIEYADYREIDGVLIPHDQIVYPIKMNEDQSKFIHRLRISDFEFDDFDVQDLKPIQKKE